MLGRGVVKGFGLLVDFLATSTEGSNSDLLIVLVDYFKINHSVYCLIFL